MSRKLLFITLVVFGVISRVVFGAGVPAALAQVKDFKPVTEQMLLNPNPGDWLMPSRTYDWQRHSPLNQINRQNVGQLRMAWVRGMATGIHENIPIVYDGVMYVVNPGAVIQALDATNGDLIWEYKRKLPDDIGQVIGSPGRTRNLAIYEDSIFYTAPDGYLVALDARTGTERWATMVHDYKIRAQHTSGPIVVQGKVISGRSCPAPETTRAGCFLAAHDPHTGKELWRFYATPAPGEPGGDSWGDLPLEQRMASFWGLPGSYDPVRKLVYWGISNPAPYTRMKRHGGDPDAIPRSAPADLYSNSTIALDPDTGKLDWYYQHLPGDDWDSDYGHERVLLRTRVNPDPREVKWISSQLPRGQQRDVAVVVGEPGGMFLLDRDSKQFLWATPFPYDTPDFIISKVDPETGKTFINWDRVFKKDGERHTICYSNTRSYWPTAYHPGQNALYIPYVDLCVDMISDSNSRQGDAQRETVPRAGADPNALSGLAKVNLETGKVEWRHQQYAPGNGAVLSTAGDLIFWGDINRRFRALDAASGKVLWETILGSSVQMSTLTYAVNGKQYVAVTTGEGQVTLYRQFPKINVPRSHNAIYVFALP
jgi:alcohol dehydrogenase (cytochrome c)